MGECLSLATGGLWGEAYVGFKLGVASNSAATIDQELTSKVSANGRSEVTFTIQQLHVIHCSLTGAVVDFISDEDFHIRTGWYRENAIAFARELSRSLRELMPLE